MGELLKKMNMTASVVCGYFLAILMFMLMLDICTRTFGYPLIGVGELSMFVMLTTVYLGMGDCERTRSHVNVDVVATWVPPKVAKAMKIFCGILCVGTLAICSYSIILSTIDSYVGDEALSGLVNYSIWPVKCFMSIGIVLYFLQAAYNLYEDFRAPAKKITFSADH